MSQLSKVKLFRTLKIVFYCLGLPLFFFCVLWLSNLFLNENPFTGYADSNFMAGMRTHLSGTALNGVWVAAGIWAIIAIVQIILHFTVKGRKTRLFITVAVILVAMLLPVFVIDSVFTKRVNEIAAAAPAGVEVKPYSQQLSYYRTMSGEAGSKTGRIMNSTDELINAVNDFCKVYHIDYRDSSKDGDAGNTTNVPVTYYELGVDFDGNGKVERKSYDAATKTWTYNDEVIVKEKPTGAKIKKDVAVQGTGYLEIDGVRYDDCFFLVRDNPATYTWYRKSKMPTYTDQGAYGLASYNKNGLLSDGYIYGVDVALNILEDYYSSQEEINSLLRSANFSDFDTAYAQIKAEGYANKLEYYGIDEDILEGLGKGWDVYDFIDNGYQLTDLQRLYLSEMSGYQIGKYSLTTAELDQLVGMLIAAIGSSSLIDFIFNLLGDPNDTTGNSLISALANGITVRDLVNKYLANLVDPNTIFNITDMLGLTDTKVTLKQEELHPDTRPDVKYLYIKLEGGLFTEPLEIKFDESFNLDTLDTLLNAILGKIGISYDIIKTVVGLIGFQLTGDSLNIKSILMGLLQGFYWYQSPVIMPDFAFYTAKYENDEDKEDDPYYLIREAFSRYDRALYEGGMHGAMIGSTLIGDKLGGGSYSADLGYTTLAQVLQLQTDLSYKPEMYPYMSVRDMLMVFVSIVILMTILSYYAAEKEVEWATGKASAKIKGPKKKKRKGGTDVPPVSENNGEEAK